MKFLDASQRVQDHHHCQKREEKVLRIKNIPGHMPHFSNLVCGNWKVGVEFCTSMGPNHKMSIRLAGPRKPGARLSSG